MGHYTVLAGKKPGHAGGDRAEELSAPPSMPTRASLARVRQQAERCGEGYVGRSHIPFAAIIDIIEPLVIQRSSCGAVFFCKVCRLMFAEHLARQAGGDPSELICPNVRFHAAICATADEAAAALPWVEAAQ